MDNSANFTFEEPPTGKTLLKMYILIFSNTDKNSYQSSWYAAATLKVANTQGSTTNMPPYFGRILDDTVYTGII